MEIGELRKLLERMEYLQKYDKHGTFWFPDKGKDDITDPSSTWSRHLYKKHLEFFEAGKRYKFRWYSAGNQLGKTKAGTYEIACHTTGRYPHWWTGKRFTGPNDWLCIGQTVSSTRMVIQEGLLGSNPLEPGTGMLPRDCIDLETLPAAKKAATTISEIRVKHVSGGYSTIKLRSCEMDSLAIAGISANVWFDEPPTEKMWSEAVMRSLVGDKIVMVTATPVKGMDAVMTNYLDDKGWRTGEISPDKIMLSATWDDVPHLSESSKRAMLANIPPYARRARTTGEPFMEAGLVYPVNFDDDIIISPIQIPAHWKYVNGLDVGWKNTAAVIGRMSDDGTIYIVGEHLYQEKPTVEYAPLLSHIYGDTPWVVDSAANMGGQATGVSIRSQLEEYGMTCHNPAMNKAVDAGTFFVLDKMVQGKLKIFASCIHTIKEMKNYARDEKGHVIKTKDHFMDAMRYMVTTADGVATNKYTASSHNHMSSRSW